MSAKVNPEMIILAREARGLTQTALARELNCVQANVSKWESGILEFPDTLVDRLADGLDFPTTFFFQTDTRYGFGSSCFYHRKRQKMPVGDLRRIQALLNVLRLHVARLLRGAEIERITDFVRLDIEEYGSAARIAEMVRSSWHFPTGPVADLVGAIECAGGIVFEIDFETPHIDAVSQWVAGVPPLFFVNSRSPGDRQRFSLAHELGHLVMHQIPTENREREADQFAAELLMPHQDIRHSLRPLSISKMAALKTHWKVSMAALARRASDLGMISDRQYRSLMTQMSKYGYRSAEPAPIPREKPNVLRDLVRIHLEEHGYTGLQLCQLLAASERDFSLYYQPQMTSQLRVVS